MLIGFYSDIFESKYVFDMEISLKSFPRQSNFAVSGGACHSCQCIPRGLSCISLFFMQSKLQNRLAWINVKLSCFWLPISVFLTVIAAANDAQNHSTFFASRKNTSTSSANLDAEIAVLVRHCSDGDLEQLSCPVSLLLIVRILNVCFSKKVVLRGRTTASLKISLPGQVFVPAETARSPLAWSTDDRNLTVFWKETLKKSASFPLSKTNDFWTEKDISLKITEPNKPINQW